MMASQHQEPVSFQRPAPLQTPRTSFFDLPFEIRSQIWTLTFEPRILALHINQHVTPAPLDPEGKQHDQTPRTYSLAFDCSLVTSSPSKDFDEYRARLTKRAWRARLDSGSLGPSPLIDLEGPQLDEHALLRDAQLAAVEASGHTLFGGRPVLSPATLYVCQESRAIAQQRYRRTFGPVTLRGAPYRFFSDACHAAGDTSLWDYAIIGEPRIWVDFERDVIVVDSLWKPKDLPFARFPEFAPYSPLSLIRIFAKEESRRISRLGIAARHLPESVDEGDWLAMQAARDVMEVLRGRIFKSWKKEWLLGFESLRELLVDGVHHHGYHREIPGWPSPNSQLQYQPLMTMKEEILHRMGKRSAEDRELAKRPPEIRMVAENDWASFL